MNVTKQIAREVAIKLLKPKQDELKAIKDKLGIEAYKIIKSKIPHKVLLGFDYNKEYFKHSRNIQVRGYGFNFEWIEILYVLPYQNTAATELNQDEANILMPLWNQKNDKLEEIENLRTDLENAILTLRTYARIKEQLPEAYELLPDKTSTAISINLESIKTRLHGSKP